MGKFFRTNLGPHFSEGTRQTWLKLRELGWSLSRTSTEIGAKGGMLHKLLYGDRRPGLTLAMAIEAKLGVDGQLWGKPALEAFLPPAAVVDDLHEQPSTGAAA